MQAFQINEYRASIGVISEKFKNIRLVDINRITRPIQRATP